MPVWTKYSATVQTGPVAHPASYTVGIGSLQGVKRPGRNVDHPSSSIAEVKERIELFKPTGVQRNNGCLF